MSGSPVSFSQLQNTTGEKSSGQRTSIVKTTTVPWNPSKPPKAPTLNSWLKAQDGVSPFGPINLPTDTKDPSPLGWQLKSPLPRIDVPKSPRMTSGIPVPTRSPNFPSFINNKSTIAAMSKSPLSLKQPDALPQHSIPGPEYRESKSSVWTEGVPYQSPSPPLQSPPKRKIPRSIPIQIPASMNKDYGMTISSPLQSPPKRKGPRSIPIQIPASVSKDYGMTIPSPRAPIRTTAEWFAAHEEAKAQDSADRTSISTANIGIGIKKWRPSFGLPGNPSLGIGSGLPRPNQRSVRSVEGDVQGLNRFLGAGDRISQISWMGSDKGQTTPGVGKAL